MHVSPTTFVDRDLALKTPQSFVDMEMSLDSSFEGDVLELTTGVFVSYKYTGTHPNGAPFRPMVNSLNFYHFSNSEVDFCLACRCNQLGSIAKWPQY
jgi:hypothetical protein